MKTMPRRLKVVKEEYELLKSYVSAHRLPPGDEKNKSWLDEKDGVELIDEEDFPWEAVRLDSSVTIRENNGRLKYSYTVVMPDESDHRKCKVSVFSTIGSALFGHQRGEIVSWTTVGGTRWFTILKVSRSTTRDRREAFNRA